MIRIITGPINSGKTTRLIDEYKKCTNGDGFASLKLMNGDDVEGFDVMRLSNKHRVPFARKNTDGSWKECCSYGPYNFSAEAIEYIDRTTEELIYKEGIMLFLDEIGSLELANRCLHGAMSKILVSGCDAVFTVRDTNLKDVMQKYGMVDAVIIETGERYV